MFPYLLLVGIPAAFSLLSNKIAFNNQRRDRVIAVFFFIFIILLSFRNSNIGSDTSTYKMYYDIMEHTELEGTFLTGFEYGYVLL